MRAGTTPQMTDLSTLEARIGAAYEDRGLLSEPEHRAAVIEVVSLLDAGRVRVASPTEQGWVVHALI